MGKVISVITEKGGVGKTTSTIHIGGALELLGYKVLLIDFDTQKNLSLGYNIEEKDVFNVEDFMEGKKEVDYVHRGAKGNISIICGSNSTKEKKLTINSLKKPLKKIKNDFDFILIDCPPKPVNDDLSFGEIAVNASDFLISPIKADKYSIHGIISFINSINELSARKKINTTYLGFFFNEVETNTNHFRKYYALLENSSANKFLFSKFIRKDVLVKKAMDRGKTIFEMDEKSRASLDFIQLTKEILKKIQ